MAYEFLVGHGMVVKMKGSAGPGASIQGWPRSVGQGLVTVDSVSPVERDVCVPVVAADNFRALYRFGQDFGQITVSGTIYLGCTAGGRAASVSAIDKVQQAYQKLRLSSRATPTNVSLAGGGKWSVVFTEFKLTSADPQFQKVGYALSGLVIPKSE